MSYLYPNIQHSKIFRCCTGVEYQFQLLNKNQAKLLVHETQGLITTVLELSFLHFLTTYSHFYRSTEKMLSHQSITLHYQGCLLSVARFLTTINKQIKDNASKENNS